MKAFSTEALEILEKTAHRQGFLLGLTLYANEAGHSALKSDNPIMKKLMEMEITPIHEIQGMGLMEDEAR